MSWKPSTGELDLQPLALDGTGNPVKVLSSRTAFQNWFPGFKQGRFRVHNNSDEAVTLTLRALPANAQGCWWAGQWADAGPFPTKDTSPVVDPGKTSDPYVMGGLTAGDEGQCGTGDFTSQWRGYLVITPVARPADARIIDIQLNRNWTVDVSDQTGGSTTVDAARVGGGAAFGTWEFTVNTPPAPVPANAPQVSASVLTTSLRTRPTVYRFDVAALTWTVSTASSPAQLVIPPLLVQGCTTSLCSTDDSTWDDLGYFLSTAKLSSTSDADNVPVTVGDVTAGAGTFYWENDAGCPKATACYTQIRVKAGALVSDPVILGSLTTPVAPKPAVTAVNTVGSPTPVPDGIDQVPLQVTLNVVGGATLASNDPAYQAIYYTDSNGDLITNLYDPKQFDQFVGVQPSAGATAAPPSRDNSTTTQAYDYVTTTQNSDLDTNEEPQTENIFATFGDGPTQKSEGTPVTGTPLAIDTVSGVVAQTPGFSLEGCKDFTGSGTCSLATTIVAGVSTRPALFQAGPIDGAPYIEGVPYIGVQLQYQAHNALSDLPLKWPFAQGEQKLGSTDVSVNQAHTLASIDSTLFLKGALLDIPLVTHGESVTVTVAAGGNK